MQQTPMTEKTWTIRVCQNCYDQVFKPDVQCPQCGGAAANQKVVLASWRTVAYEKEVEVGKQRREIVLQSMKGLAK